jgi:hypothetical protein
MVSTRFDGFSRMKQLFTFGIDFRCFSKAHLHYAISSFINLTMILSNLIFNQSLKNEIFFAQQQRKRIIFLHHV